MAYVWTGKPKSVLRSAEQTLEQETKDLLKKLRSLETRKKTWAAKVEESKADLAEIRKLAVEELAVLENQKYLARQEIIDAQREASLIREMATEQARALAERAYRSGFERGQDIAKAKHITFAKVQRLSEQKALATGPDGRAGVTRIGIAA
ncbi:hypothetical protein [Paenarthrobacter sp. CAP02]|uniref:hypothetical protein n=1 Tax=Paenarthrobacter sp. CAP02 TaxID=3158144 RepID=UPI0032DB0939